LLEVLPANPLRGKLPLKFIIFNNDYENEGKKQPNDTEVDDNNNSQHSKSKTKTVDVSQLRKKVENLKDHELCWPDKNACPYIRALVFHAANVLDSMDYYTFEKQLQPFLNLSLKLDDNGTLNNNDENMSSNTSQNISDPK